MKAVLHGEERCPERKMLQSKLASRIYEDAKADLPDEQLDPAFYQTPA